MTRDQLRAVARKADLHGWGKFGAGALRQFLKGKNLDGVGKKDVVAKGKKDPVATGKKVAKPGIFDSLEDLEDLDDLTSPLIPYWKEGGRQMRDNIDQINKGIAALNAMGTRKITPGQ